MRRVLGIDIGGTGIKGAPVSLRRGSVLKDVFRIETPRPATPRAVAKVVCEIAEHFEWRGPIGCGFPAMVHGGVVQRAANMHPRWVGIDAEALFARATGGRAVGVINDADAAGIAEMRFGAGRRQNGVVAVLTFGTGIGSAVFSRGTLVPNTDLGEISIDGVRSGLWASDRARADARLSWKRWAKRVTRFLDEVDRLLLPDLIIIGGGASYREDEFFGLLRPPCPVVAATMRNEAGIVGAAFAARRLAR